ncbi:protein phosphatase regulator REG1 [Aspergillus mulundensis]|uniref:Nitrogen regulatory protein areA GATA-like domain-containing protein n=1 Tax=Aspergillus mulundensis TaxID=1810919 RepID=A0A3D8QR67_9EURO|nr:hypothetical protein DSM5745_09703 [Aspergillus mulundensis]RDW64292.1 hypothetical protein DSM5745_09703 [Aspergillus mulundensis]
MTAVLPSPADSRLCFSPDPVGRQPVTQRYFLETDDSMAKLPHIYTSDYPSPITCSAASSSPSSPNFAPVASQNFPPTPTSSTGSVSSSEPGDQDDELLLPAYDSAFFPEEPSAASDTSDILSADSTRSAPQISAADDSSVEEEPSRHVDYLSHEWREEDIWASWRYVVARREVYENGVRLENASWRTWTKLRHNLGTISPDTLNWLKDCDVTWLYGPLKTSRARVKSLNLSPPPSCSESPSNCPDRKSILKKRTASETMLQRSLSQHTLLQHAGAILKAQEAGHSRNRTTLGVRLSEFELETDKQSDETLEATRTRFAISVSPSGAGSPSERRHIHFNKEVLQCIAVEGKDEEEEFLEFGGDLSWDDSFIVKPASPSGGSTPRANSSGENKTIAPLPPTTLKYRGDTPEPQPSSVINPWSWTKYIPGRRLYSSSIGATTRQSQGSPGALGDSRTDPGHGRDWTQDVDDSSNSWFVDPADEDEDAQNFYLASLGFRSQEHEQPSNVDVLVDRVVDTVNTAKDILFLMRNVGWRG